MRYIQFKNLPQFIFAHIYRADNYHTILAPNKNQIEISYIAKGNLICTQNNQTFEAKQNDIICNTFLSPTKIHAANFHEHHTVCFSIPFSSDGSQNEELVCLPNITHSAEDGNRILSCIDEIIRQSTINANHKLTCIGLFFRLIDLIDECNRKKSSSVRYSDFQYVEKAKKYIFEHLNAHIEQKEVAKYLGISPEYLCSVFKNAEGVSLITFINRIKLEKIQVLIKKEKLKLYQAAELYGYADPNYVSRLYKKYFHKNITE